MISQKHISYLQEKTRKYFPDKEKVKIFIFGSSLDENRKRFFDIDLGFKGDFATEDLAFLRGGFQESNFPYKVDLINFNKVSKDFEKTVFSGKIEWL